MYAIEDLMALGYSKRQVQTIASEMGYPKANQYDSVVYNELKQRKDPQKQPRSRVEATQEAAQQHQEANFDIDLADVDEGAQRRAAAMVVGRDALTMFYLATHQFTVPGLKDQVDSSRSKLRAALQGNFYEPDHFLSQIAIGGTNGATRSLSGSNPTSTASEDITDAEPLPIAD